MATVVICDRQGCGEKADVHVDEFGPQKPYLFPRGGLDLCLKDLQAYTYEGGGYYKFKDRE